MLDFTTFLVSMSYPTLKVVTYYVKFRPACVLTRKQLFCILYEMFTGGRVGGVRTCRDIVKI